MGVLSWLGKIGAGIAAPFTGGASLAAIPAIDALGNALGGGAGAAKDGRMNEAALQAQMDAANNRSRVEAGAFNQGAESSLMRRALMAQLLSQGPSGMAMDPRAAKYGQGNGPSPEMQAMLQRYGLLARSDLNSGAYRVTPQLSTIPESGVMEKIGGIAGTASGVLGALGQIPTRKKPKATDQPPLAGPISSNVRLPGL